MNDSNLLQAQKRLGIIGTWSMAAIMVELWISLLFVLPKYAQITMDTLDSIYADPDKFLPSFIQHPLVWHLMEMDLLFSIALFLAALGLGGYLLENSPLLSKLSTAAGLIGAGMCFALGMLEFIANPILGRLYVEKPLAAGMAYQGVNAISQALDRGVIFASSCWMLLVSLAGMRGRQLPRWLSYLGFALFFSGTFAPVFPPLGLVEPVLVPAFLVWLGFSLCRGPVHRLQQQTT